MVTSSRPKIAVIGAGAVGSLIGGLLAHAGEDVTLIARGAHVNALHEKGLQIEGVLGTLIIPVKAAETLEFKPDLLLLAVKSQDVETACQSIKEMAKDATILTLQNGTRSDEIVASFFPREHIISGVVMLNAQFLQPGQIIYARSGALLIGEAFTKNGIRGEEIRALLQPAIQTEISPDIRGAHWAKLLVNNLGNGLEAMTGMSINECMQHEVMKRIGILTLREGAGVIRKAGYKLASLPGVPAGVLRFLVHAPLPVAGALLKRSFGKARTLSSTLQSLKRGRPTEIDYLNGEIVMLAKQIGMECPFNAKIVELVKAVEKGGGFLSPAALAGQFGL